MFYSIIFKPYESSLHIFQENQIIYTYIYIYISQENLIIKLIKTKKKYLECFPIWFNYVTQDGLLYNF